MPLSSNTKPRQSLHRLIPSVSSISECSSHSSGTVACPATTPISTDFITNPLSNEVIVTSFPRQTFQPQDSTYVNTARCKNIVQAIRKIKPLELFVYEDVSADDFAYITSTVGSDESHKAKLAFFPGQSRLTVTMSSSTHEALIICLQNFISSAIATMQFRRDRTWLSIHTNTRLIGPNISGDPDLQLRLSFVSNIRPLAKIRSLWIVEVGFTQGKKGILDKLRAFIADSPWALLVCMIIIKETPSFRAPGKRTAAAREARQNEAIDEEGFMAKQSALLGPVTVDGYRWASPSAIEIHVWVRPSDDTTIDIDNLSPDNYACGTLYPTEHLQDVDALFRRGLELVRDAVLRGTEMLIRDEAAAAASQENTLSAIKAWTPPAPFLDDQLMRIAMGKSLWETAYFRYKDWYDSLRPRRAVGRAQPDTSVGHRRSLRRRRLQQN